MRRVLQPRLQVDGQLDFRRSALIGSRLMAAAGVSGRAKVIALIGALAAALALTLALSRNEAAAAGTNCPTFRVLHNDRIGPAVLPAGTYNVHLTRGSKLSCGKASSLFARFLQDFDGNIAPWRVVPKGRGKARFLKPGNRGFSVARAGAGRGGHQRLGHLCPGTFHVLHNDRIGPLFFRAGIYQIYIPNHSVVPCKGASNHFARFLAFPAGVLPGNWQMKSNRAVFFKKNQPKKRRFRVDPGT
jgi:hypothetical protein